MSASARRRSRRPRRARVLARGRTRQVVHEGRRVRRRRSARAFSRPTRPRPPAGSPPGRQTAEGALALVIVLDQFPRNMFRGSARAFAADPLARAVAERAIARGFDQACRHAGAAVLLSAVRAFRRRSPTRSAASRCSARPAMPTRVKWAEMHADIIRRFGRFPASQRGARPHHDARGAGVSRCRRLRGLTARRVKAR